MHTFLLISAALIASSIALYIVFAMGQWISYGKPIPQEEVADGVYNPLGKAIPYGKRFIVVVMRHDGKVRSLDLESDPAEVFRIDNHHIRPFP